MWWDNPYVVIGGIIALIALVFGSIWLSNRGQGGRDRKAHQAKVEAGLKIKVIERGIVEEGEGHDWKVTYSDGSELIFRGYPEVPSWLDDNWPPPFPPHTMV